MKEKLLPYEKLQLATSQIQLMSLQLTHLTGNLQGISSMHNTADEHMSFINDLSKDCINIMNKLTTYMENIDAVTETDVILFKKVIHRLNKDL